MQVWLISAQLACLDSFQVIARSAVNLSDEIQFLRFHSFSIPDVSVGDQVCL